MGTQAVISVTKDNRVQYKIVAGCNGQKAASLAEFLRFCLFPYHPEAVRAIARRMGLGCSDCLVVSYRDRNGNIGHLGEGQGSIRDQNRLYEEKFDDPKFNPRWEAGTADRTFIVEVGSADKNKEKEWDHVSGNNNSR